MNELQIFNSSEFGEIRTVTKDGEPMFCLADICKALELTNSRVVADRLEEDERCKLNLPRQGETWFITESGLYAVILRSDKPNAKQFRKWVTGEVLPSIRKTGSYGVPKTQSEQIQLIAQGYVELEQEVHDIRHDVTDLKDNMPLYACDIEEVSNHVKRKVVNILGGKESEAYQDKSVRGQVFSNIYTRLKMEYGAVSSYKSIKRKYLADIHDFIDCYELPRFLEELVNDANAQMRIA